MGSYQDFKEREHLLLMYKALTKKSRQQLLTYVTSIAQKKERVKFQLGANCNDIANNMFKEVTAET